MLAKELVGKGDEHFNRKEYAEALVLYRSALAESPEDPELFQDIGATLVQMGRYRAAIKSYDRAIGLNPEEWWYHLGKGDSLYSLENFKKALSSYRKANLLLPGASMVLLSMARCQVALGRKRAALRSLLSC